MQTAWSENCSIRRLAAADIPVVAALESAELSAWSEASIAAELGRFDGAALVVCDGTSVAGWGCCRHSTFEAELLRISVRPSVRRRGLGSMLLEGFFSLYRQQSVGEMYLEVRSRNHAAITFYLGHGFTEVGRRINYYRQPSDDALVLKKILNLGGEGQAK